MRTVRRLYGETVEHYTGRNAGRSGVCRYLCTVFMHGTTVSQSNSEIGEEDLAGSAMSILHLMVNVMAS